ncbi:MAG: conjugative transfer protein MobI(A/C) [Acidiferrobacter sp.]
MAILAAASGGLADIDPVDCTVATLRIAGHFSIEWLFHKWYIKDGKHRFMTLHIKKGREIIYSETAITRYARVGDRDAVIEAEKKFSEIRRKSKGLSETKMMSRNIGYPEIASADKDTDIDFIPNENWDA